MIFTIEKEDRVSEEAHAVIGHQWSLNDRWVFSRLADVFEFINLKFSPDGIPMKETEEERSLLREQCDQFLNERNTARQLAMDLAERIEAASPGFWKVAADLEARVSLMKGKSSYEFPVRERFTN